MVTPEHEALHRIFHEDPGLFARAMAKILGHQVTVPDKITVLNCDLTETKPAERRLDSVLLAEILAETGTGRYILVIESQTEPEDDKRRRWPYAETGAVLAEFTEAGLGTTAGLTIWRQLMAMKGSYPYVSQMRAQGRTEGHAEGLAEGLLDGRRGAILRIFANRGIAVSDDLRGQINACADADILDRWFDMAMVVKDSNELLLNA
jgi:hypothetical protein